MEASLRGARSFLPAYSGKSQRASLAFTTPDKVLQRAFPKVDGSPLDMGELILGGCKI